MGLRPSARSIALLAALSVCLAACSDENGSGAEPEQAPPATVSSTGDSLEWTEPDDYTYVLESRCGERSLIGTFEVTVNEGAVQDVSALDEDAEAMLEHIGPDPAPTIGELVMRLRTATQDGADIVNLEVDSDDGYPSLIEIDHDTNSIDDEACYMITDFVHG